jgi:membrane protein implicated in regulation of membrane protease activity
MMMWLSQIAIGGIEISPSGLWLIFGAGLCLLELFVPTAFTAVCMGVSALLVSLLALTLPSAFGLQIFVWLLGSCGLAAIGYRLNKQRTSSTIRSATEAEALTSMMPNETGRVLYEGSSWRARCAEGSEPVAPQDKLYVVGREGNLLIVMPMHPATGD